MATKSDILRKAKAYGVTKAGIDWAAVSRMLDQMANRLKAQASEQEIAHFLLQIGSMQGTAIADNRQIARYLEEAHAELLQAGRSLVKNPNQYPKSATQAAATALARVANLAAYTSKL